MGDLLKYRFPKESVVTKLGKFIPFERKEEDQFVVFPFSGGDAYAFEENSELIKEFNFKKLPNDLERISYLEFAEVFKKKLVAGRLSKAIFSRTKIVEQKVDPEVFFDALCLEYPEVFVYLISSESFGTWIGASPEILLEGQSGIGSTVALAGTMKASDRERWGGKEQQEQQFVTDYIAQKLAGSVNDLRVEEAREVVAGPVKHLKSSFTFTFPPEKALDVALSLHPTPAVSGLPQEESIELIEEQESYNRELYTGFLGMVGEKTSLYVNLRCAQIGDSSVCLYLGGGFTKDSDIEKEWEETENKSHTLLKVLEKL